MPYTKLSFRKLSISAGGQGFSIGGQSFSISGPPMAIHGILNNFSHRWPRIDHKWPPVSSVEMPCPSVRCHGVSVRAAWVAIILICIIFYCNARKIAKLSVTCKSNWDASKNLQNCTYFLSAKFSKQHTNPCLIYETLWRNLKDITAADKI